jgi:hypothetical protein
MEPKVLRRGTMTLNLKLPPDTEKKLYERASQAGESVEGIALRFIEDALRGNGSRTTDRTSKTFDEILAPVRAGWQQSELSDEQVDELFDDTLRKIRSAKRKDHAQ